MKKTLIFSLLFVVGHVAVKAQDIPARSIQIKVAVKPAPKAFQDNATVLGYNKSGTLVKLREGTNNFICLADDPQKKGFNVSCYHKDLEPYMKRGRTLRAEGKSFDEIRKIRGEEIKSGELNIPDKGTLYVLSGDFDAVNGEVKNAYTRYVIYIPYATEASTGLSSKPSGPGSPWIMDAGTHRAHIMINPPK